MGTGRDHRNVMKTGFGVLFLLALLQTGTDAQGCPPTIVARFNENNTVGTVVTTIPVTENVDLQYQSPDKPFALDMNRLLVTAVLDYEDIKRYEVTIGCTVPGQPTVPFNIIVIVENLNDNPPRFGQRLYTLDVSEMTPVGDLLMTDIRATDPDNLGPLIYTLTSSSDLFRLKSPNDPGIVVNKPLDFDSVKTVQLTLTVQDEVPEKPGHTDTTTIDITITDGDNRPPWFQPCTEIVVQGIKICPNTGYQGSVKLGQLEPEPIPLKPNNIWAKDGDNGINEPIAYVIVSGSQDFFTIDAETGSLTMVKAVNVTTVIHMTVMATQAVNSHQFATTSVMINVLASNLHPPQFEKELYDAVVTGVGTIAMDAADTNNVVKILAKDEDYTPAGGINPNIVYTITGSSSSAFSLIEGFLFMSTEVPGGIYNLQVNAEDMESFETVTTQLRVEVVPEPTTTVPPTTISTAPTEPTSEPTTPAPTTGPTTVVTPDQTSNPSTIVTNPTSNPTPTPNESGKTTIGTPGVSDQTSNPVPTTEGTTGSTAHTGSEIKPPGSFRSADMAALGATLGCLLFICIVVIAVLAVKLRKGGAAWKKINEASAFRSSLGPSGQKEGVQFTNEAFQHDDGGKDNKGGPSGGGLKNGSVHSGLEMDKPKSRSIPRPPSPIQDEEKEVKPILTKDKLKEDGYKAVWFKEDIDPNAKEDVVIIPDNRAEEEDEDEMKIPKVKFNDTDRDSGLGDKIEDSEEDKVMSSNL
ncbi:cadherin-related family member 5-like isoform X1 [Periophthalmus magnuspinnatus]|uniref:cadherin-related family member 5-like isoform X1 n=1 Tax=Periophthalmus magnuspinnatus TaxID=409849 RepID=UPI00145A1E32|nr:cadherin-related family member 5-like isoform X1 [Periophthalmus magnuspinnatus]